MLITRTSPLTKERNTMDLDITDAQMAAFLSGTMVQDAFPNLPKEQREFILTGYTPEDWAKIFPPEEDGEEE